MDLMMPPSFPIQFEAFGRATSPFFPKIVSTENFADPLKRLAHFNSAWQAVRYRYRSCADCNDEFKSLLANPGELWEAGWQDDEELTYRLERCVYTFFISGLSVFESFGFCLYFLGGSVHPGDFPHCSKPIKIKLSETHEAFKAAFPRETITYRLGELSKDPDFIFIDRVRNILAHRLSGRQSSRASSVRHSDGTCTRTAENTWDILGSTGALTFDKEMLQVYLDKITGMLTVLAEAAREFADGQRPARAPRAASVALDAA
jgi:hypothetical protein